MGWSAYELRKAWNQIKDQVAPWWPENSKEAYAGGVANLASALSNWSASRSGQRRGKPVRFPKFKSKRARLSCRFSTGEFGLVNADRRHVRLPRIGVVRTHESTRKLARRIDAGTARIRSATLTFERGRWIVSFSVELHLGPAGSAGHRRGLGAVVGVDLGITHLAVLSTPVPGVADESGMVDMPDRLALRSGGCADYSAKPLAAVALIGAPVSRRRGDGVAPTLRSPVYTPASPTPAPMIYTSSPPHWLNGLR